MDKAELLVKVRSADPAFLPDLAVLYGIDQGSPEFDQLAEDVDGYCRSVAPVPVLLRYPHDIKPLLDMFRKQRELNQQRPTSFYVVFIDGSLFKKIVDGNIETTHSYNQCAAFLDFLAARDAGLRLDKMGAFRVRVTRITNEIRKPETISDKLADFGFQQAQS